MLIFFQFFYCSIGSYKKYLRVRYSFLIEFTTFRDNLQVQINVILLLLLISQYKIDYMEFRLWIGVWCAVFILALVAFNLSFLVKYITRFTEDCFATLVAIIFIIDAIKSTLHLRDLDEADLVVKASSLTADSYSNVTDEMETMSNLTMSSVEYINKNSPDYALIKMTREADFFFSVILFLMTFVICMGLKEFRNKPFLPTKVLYDFFSSSSKFNFNIVKRSFV